MIVLTAGRPRLATAAGLSRAITGAALLTAASAAAASLYTSNLSNDHIVEHSTGLLSAFGSHKKKHPSTPTHEIDTAEQWSSIFGWVSIASWVIVYSPQLHENYVLKSADGLSITFVYIWLAGDALNGLGAIRQGLLWTMIILALYYVLCDIALILQYYYYRKYYKNGVRIVPSSSSSNERTPLLNGTANGNATAIAVEDEDLTPAAAAAHHEEEAGIEDDSPASWKTELVRYALALALVFLTGVLAWYFGSRHEAGSGGHPSKGGHGRHHHKDPPKYPDAPENGSHEWKWDAQIFGWASAILYLSSRLPQIAKNRHTKCEGLSLALFLFAVMGNVTYVASIMIKSQEREYLLENLSWLVGSIGTIFLDFIVLSQFIFYAGERKRRREAMKASGRRRAASFSEQ